MINDRFKDKMRKLEQEREEFIQKLTPERRKEFQQKKEEYNQKQGLSQDWPSPDKPKE
jgi:hypothetical protein